MAKSVAIIQSNYIPWKGYFDIISRVDEFILYDDAQYTRRDWRNRNKIKTPAGPAWMTIPVQVKGKYYQAIRQTLARDHQWRHQHWRMLMHHYSKASYFKAYADPIESLYLESDELRLSWINRSFISAINHLLGIDTTLSWSWDYGPLPESPTAKLVHLCRQAGATDYLSGPAARDYMDTTQFDQAGIRVHWMDYSHYPVYPQFHPPFEHGVTILDLIFHVGKDALRYMNSDRGGHRPCN